MIRKSQVLEVILLAFWLILIAGAVRDSLSCDPYRMAHDLFYLCGPFFTAIAYTYLAIILGLPVTVILGILIIVFRRRERKTQLTSYPVSVPSRITAPFCAKCGRRTTLLPGLGFYCNNCRLYA